MYHEVLEDSADVDAWTVVRRTDFVRQMESLREHFQVVPLDDALATVVSGAARPRNLVVVTFDDGYAGNSRVVLPVIEELQIPVTIFVATGAVQSGVKYWYDHVILSLLAAAPTELDLSEFGLTRYVVPGVSGTARWVAIQRLLTDLKRQSPEQRDSIVAALLDRLPARRAPIEGLTPLTVSEIRRMAASSLITFGAHSHCHSRLCQLSLDGVRRTVERSKSLLEDWTGGSVRHFSYPNGDYTADIASVVKSFGFRTAVTTDARLWSRGHSVLAIPRLGVGRYDTLNSFRARVSGIVR
jgi:peptidoglycan/xylan/chitin deacetylase (PgdA/CDA1 family)